jgi:hypothetical protein
VLNQLLARGDVVLNPSALKENSYHLQEWEGSPGGLPL